jgi:hypothetical protein
MLPTKGPWWGLVWPTTSLQATALQSFGLMPVADNSGMTTMQTFAEPQPWH